MIWAETDRVGNCRVVFDLGGKLFGWKLVSWYLIWVGIDRVVIVRMGNVRRSDMLVYRFERNKYTCIVY